MAARKKAQKSTGKTSQKRKPKLEDCLVRQLREKGAIGRTRVLMGYLEEPGDDGRYTLYLGPALDDAVTFPQEAVVHMILFVTSQDPKADIGARMVWIKKDADVRYVGPRKARDQARFLEGVFAENAAALSPNTASILSAKTVGQMMPTGTHGDC